MGTYPFVTVDVFTATRFGGNPLAVFPDARGLSDAQMQALANEFNLSETTFVLPPENPANTARVRIFTRTAEMPFAGHPNVGTGYVLAQMGRDTGGVLLFEELAGLVEVRVARDGHGAVTGATIAAPQPLSLGLELPVEAVAACAGLQPDDIVTTAHRPIQASVGNPFAIAEVTDDALTRATPQIDAFRRAWRSFPRSARSWRCTSTPAARAATSARGCSRHWAAPSKTRRRAAPRRRSPPCCSRSATRRRPATTSRKGSRCAVPACCAPRRGARPTASAPGSAATASRCCAARRMCS